MNKISYKHIPNILTIFRIVLIIPILFFIFFEMNEFYSIDFGSNIVTKINLNIFIAGILFILSALTDALDGYLARKHKWISEFGKIWDPIADKIAINLVLIAFTIENMTLFYVPAILIFRDTIVDGYRLQAVKNKQDVSANIFGKIKTILLFIGIILIFFLFSFESQSEYHFQEEWYFYIIQNGLLHVALIAAILSGVIYVLKFHKK